MYRLYKHQKRVNGEWVDDTTVAPSIDANRTRKKVISFTSDASCYNGDVINERWVDDGIIEADCFQKFDDYDDTKQEYLGCFDGRTPSVTIKGGPENTKLQYSTYNTEKEISNWDVNLDENGNGYFELKDDEILYRVYLPTDNGQPDYPLSEVYIKGCNVATANPIGGYGKIVFYCSKIISDRPNYSVYHGAYSYIYNGVDTSKSTTMMNMFQDCSKLTSLDLSGWNTSKVKNMDGMFQNCSGLTSLDLSSFDTRNVTYMDSMFEGCSKLKSLDLSNFNTSGVKDMSWMFDYCISLTSLDLSGWDISRTINKPTFSECSKLKTIRMVGCDQDTIDVIKSLLTDAGILNQVTIIT